MEQKKTCKKRPVKETNTLIIFNSAIDYFLLFLWTSSKLNDKIVDKIIASLFPEKNDLIEIINKIELIQWNMAKSTWILKILFNDYCLD